MSIVHHEQFIRNTMQPFIVVLIAKKNTKKKSCENSFPHVKSYINNIRFVYLIYFVYILVKVERGIFNSLI